MTKWEYLTAPILTHAAKQILDNFGADGWELVQIAPGMNPENLVGYFKRPLGGMSTPEERLAELGLAVPEVPKPVAVYVPAVRSGDQVFTSGQLPMRDGELMATGKVGAEVDRGGGRTPARSSARSTRSPRSTPRSATCRGAAGRQGRRLRGVLARTSPASRRSPTAPRSCSARSSATPACTPGRPSACRSCRWTRRSRSRSSSSCDATGMRIPLPPVPLPDQLVEVAREFADGRP